jgi:hypothetical protein
MKVGKVVGLRDRYAKINKEVLLMTCKKKETTLPSRKGGLGWNNGRHQKYTKARPWRKINK